MALKQGYFLQTPKDEIFTLADIRTHLQAGGLVQELLEDETTRDYTLATLPEGVTLDQLINTFAWRCVSGMALYTLYSAVPEVASA